MAKRKPTGTPESSRASCTCKRCVSCCEQKPGWMKPGEAERMADFLGLSLADLFAQFLAVDWWVSTTDVFLLSPALAGEEPGTEMPYIAEGRCVFLTEAGRCRVHPVKPFECAAAWCGDGPVRMKGSAHEQAAEAWRPAEHQQQIASLLGHTPIAATGNPLSFLFR